MSERLLIRLHPDGRLSWLAQDAANRPLSAANTGAPAPATLARARRIVVLVPSEHVSLLETDAVSARRAQLVKAIPFALEDQLVSPVEDLHFALPERIEGAGIGVAVVARTTLQQWIDMLAANGIQADCMLPETLALPLRDGVATLMIEADRAFLRAAATRAVTIDTPALAPWLTALAPAPLAVLDCREAPRLNLPVPIAEYRERQGDALASFAAHLVDAPAINLLQGDFAPRHRHAPAQQLWRRAALACVAALALAVLFAAGDYLRLERESARLEDSERAALRSSLPELGAVAGDPRALMQSAFSRLHGDGVSGELLQLLERIGPVLANTTRVQLRGLEYRNAVLELGLRAPDVPTLDVVREQIANLGGLRVEVTSATSSEKGVDGRLRVSGAKR